MPRTGRPKAELVLTAEEREQLQRWARRAKSAQALALRSKIVLACAEGLDNKTVAAKVGCSQPTVGKWRGRFVEHRLDGLTDEERPGRPTTVTVDQVEDVLVATLESAAKKRARAEEAFKRADEELRDLLVKGRAEGKGPSHMAKLTGFTREWVAKIAPQPKS